jgi:hypothetical protein
MNKIIEITTDKLEINPENITTYYVKCKCQICKKEFMGFSGSLTCNEKHCDKEWMNRNIHSKIELAKALQKEKNDKIITKPTAKKNIMKCQYITEDSTCCNEEATHLLEINNFAINCCPEHKRHHTTMGYWEKLIIERNDTIDEMRVEINKLKAEIKKIKQA